MTGDREQQGEGKDTNWKAGLIDWLLMHTRVSLPTANARPLVLLLVLRLLLLLTFLLFLIVTRATPGTGFMPSFCIAFLLFFSGLLCLPPLPVPASPSSSSGCDNRGSMHEGPCCEGAG
jgi:hypothetical protein